MGQYVRGIRARCAAGLVAVVLGACGGGGGGGGSGGGDGATGVFSADFAPLSAGDRRLYRLTTGSDAGRLRWEVVGARQPVGGQQAWVVRDETAEPSCLVTTASGVTALAGSGADPLTQALGSTEVLRFGLRTGEAAALAERRLRMDADGDGRLDAVRVNVRFTVVGFEDLSTALARFAGSAHVRSQGTVSVSLANGGTSTVQVDADEC